MASVIKNEKIRASEVNLTGLQGESLGIIPTKEALRLAKEQDAELICTSMMISPPPCVLVKKGSSLKLKKSGDSEIKKTKELRFTVNIEDHDYDTKLRQASKWLESNHSVQLIVKVQGKESALAKTLLEKFTNDLKQLGKKQSGIQVSGKQVAVMLLPIEV